MGVLASFGLGIHWDCGETLLWAVNTGPGGILTTSVPWLPFCVLELLVADVLFFIWGALFFLSSGCLAHSVLAWGYSW